MRTFLLLLLFILPGPLLGQVVTLTPVGDSPADTVLEALEVGVDQKVQTVLADWLRDIQQRGYLEASVDSLFGEKDQWEARVYLGPRYRWGQLDLSALPARIREVLGEDTEILRGQVFRSVFLEELQTRIQGLAAEQGYALARVAVELEPAGPGQLNARVTWDSGPVVVWDSLSWKGDLDLSPAFLARYLGMEPGTPFSQKRLDLAAERLRNLRYIGRASVAGVRIQNGKARPELELMARPASRFDFIIGVLPNSALTGRLLVTGDVEAEFFNAFGRGERLYAHFEQLRPQTQDLALALEYPYLFDLPFGVDLDFRLYKRDSSFLDLEYNLGLQYLMEGGNYIKAFWQNKQSNLLLIQDERIREEGRLPPNLDLNQRLFGLALFYQQLDYPLNPRRGWSVDLQAAVGSRKIRPNARIEDLDLDLYADLDRRSYQYQLEGTVMRFFPLGRRSVLQAAMRGGFLLSREAIYQNEQFRIGGNRLLRGFDEEQFFASNFLLGTLEYRFLLSQNAYLFGFVDQAWLDDRTPRTGQVLYPRGFGAGLSLETSAGLFRFSLALGQSENIPLDLNKPRVHFGYVSLF